MPPPDYYKAKKSNWGAKKTTSKKGKGRKSSKVVCLISFVEQRNIY